jgi:hypothetical protein
MTVTVRGFLVSAAGLCLGLSAAGCPSRAPAPAPATTVPTAPREESMSSTIRIQETTVADLGPFRVGVSNLWERDFVRDGATVHLMSANLSILDTATSEERSVKAYAGFDLDLGPDRYRVVEVTAGSGGRGSVVLEKVAR